jgi:hypothetical protein
VGGGIYGEEKCETLRTYIYIYITEYMFRGDQEEKKRVNFEKSELKNGSM